MTKKNELERNDMKKSTYLWLFVGLMLIVGIGVTSSCGRQAAGPITQDVKPPPVTPPVPPVTPPPADPPGIERKATTLVVFGAVFCGACKYQFPKLNEYVGTLSAKAREKLTSKVYVTAGDPSGVRPTQVMAEQYASTYFPLAQGIMDPWRWTTYRQMLPGSMTIPAGVVLDENGAIIKRFPASNFHPNEIVGFIKSRVGE
jgi:thiol-disulfide isomerase/thioredoxin